jgi:hypothetical protein
LAWLNPINLPCFPACPSTGRCDGRADDRCPGVYAHHVVTWGSIEGAPPPSLSDPVRACRSGTGGGACALCSAKILGVTPAATALVVPCAITCAGRSCVVVTWCGSRPLHSPFGGRLSAPACLVLVQLLILLQCASAEATEANHQTKSFTARRLDCPTAAALKAPLSARSIAFWKPRSTAQTGVVEHCWPQAHSWAKPQPPHSAQQPYTLGNQTV